MPLTKTSDYSNSELTAINRIDLEDPVRRKALEKELLRKLDLRMSFLVVLMVLNIIDRNNTPAARLRGFEEDLQLSSKQYSTVLSILFVGYILMQIPSNIALRITSSYPSGITQDFAGALLCRFFLGAVEAAFMPGALFLLSRWYKRNELGLRSAILFCGSFVSNAFGSLIASGILDKMGGKLGESAWRWLFFIEGAVTVVIACLGFFILPDFPNTPARWLSPDLLALAEKRMHEEAGTTSIPLSAPSKVGHFAGLVMALTDWKIWWITSIMTLGQLSFSFVIFFPTLTKTLGYDTTTTLLLCAPPWVVATLAAFAVTRHSDVVRERCWHSVAPAAMAMLGFIIAMCTMNTAARYVSLFLMAVAPRAVGIALINALSQLALVAGPYAWDQSWGPSYARSFGICLAASGASVIMAVVLRQHLANLNRREDKIELERGQALPGFRYML
ncbi:MFS transporter superfamily protein [Pleurotus pulmonarius]